MTTEAEEQEDNRLFQKFKLVLHVLGIIVVTINIATEYKMVSAYVLIGMFLLYFLMDLKQV